MFDMCLLACVECCLLVVVCDVFVWVALVVCCGVLFVFFFFFFFFFFFSVLVVGVGCLVLFVVWLLRCVVRCVLFVDCCELFVLRCVLCVACCCMLRLAFLVDACG